MDWQPIETAPKDGTEILAYKTQPGIFGPYRIMSYSPANNKDGGNGFYGATHWAPLRPPEDA